jgi:phage terminase large subunit
MKIKATPVFQNNYREYNNNNVRIIINQGGTRSSKTYSILQLLIIIALKEKNLITIVRKSFPSLRGSVMRDWKDIMLEMNIYEDNRHSKTENLYTFENGSVIEFISLDDAQKVRGRKRDILYCNEANEIDYESWMQLKLRTTGKIFIDYNPSETEHWCYDLLKDEGTALIKSTYKDNPFLSQEQVRYIENLIKVDADFYKIYALGERVAPKSLVYNHFVKYDNLPPADEIIETAYGLDLGHNHFTAFIEVNFATDNRLYVRELFYQNELTAEDTVNLVANSDYNRTKMIYVDSARPDIITSLRRKGIRAQLADKKVKEGIDFIKSKQVLININSENVLRESRLYSWKELSDGKITDEIVKQHDDALDAMRYAAFTAGKTLSKTAIPFRIGR